jgi:hypothetical protein
MENGFEDNYVLVIVGAFSSSIYFPAVVSGLVPICVDLNNFWF